MTTFPTSLDSFPTVTPGQNILASTENVQSTAVAALETKVGIEGSADPNSLDYKVNHNLQYKVVKTIGTSANNDYTTTGSNDDVVFNQAIIDLNAGGGGVLQMQPNSFTCNNDVNLLSNVILQGCGEGSVMNFPTNGKRLHLNGVSHCKVRDFKIDISMQAAVNFYIAIRNDSISHCEFSGLHIETVEFGIFTASQDTGAVEDVWIHHCYIHGACNQDLIGGGKQDDAALDFRDFIVENNFVFQDKNMANSGTYYTAIDITGVKQVKLLNNVTKGNIVFGSERDPHFASEIRGNNVRPPDGTTTIGAVIDIEDNINTNATSSDLKISENTVYGGYIRVIGKSGQPIERVNVTNNNIINVHAYAGATTQNAIALTFANNCIVAQNNCFSADEVTYDAIYLTSSNNNTFIGNKVNGYHTGYNASDNTTSTNNSISGGSVLNMFTATIGTNVITSPGASIVNVNGINPDNLVYVQGSITGATTFDRLNGSEIQATLTGSITVTLNTIRVPYGTRLVLQLIQDNGGSHTVSWPSNFKKAGGSLALSAGANAIDIIIMEFDGTNWREVARALNQS